MVANAPLNPYAPPQAELEVEGSGVDTTFKLNLFSRVGRIGRIRYLGYSMAFGIVLMLVAGAMAVLSPMLALIPYIALIYAHFMLAIKRSHDFDTTGWASLLIFVPLVNLIFLFVPGTDGPNRFGNKTAPNGNSTVIVIAIALIIPIIGILAAIAIPAYQDYVNRAKAAQVQVR